MIFKRLLVPRICLRPLSKPLNFLLITLSLLNSLNDKTLGNSNFFSVNLILQKGSCLLPYPVDVS